MEILELIRQPWYIAGPLVGLTVPALLILGNKSFGIWYFTTHLCDVYSKYFFTYDWKKEIWNMFFVLGILIGGVIAFSFLSNPDPIIIDPNLRTELASYGITNIDGMLPEQIFSWENVLTLKGYWIGWFFLIGSPGVVPVVTQFQVWLIYNGPHLLWTCCFFIGLIMANFILPFILSL
jgi:hypothetical protein